MPREEEMKEDSSPASPRPQVQDAAAKAPTINEMRCVANYMAETMGLHSAAGKLLAKADKLERIVEQLMEMKR
jgi:hypothetical protein